MKTQEPDEENRRETALEVSENLLDRIAQGDVDLGVGVAQMMLSEGPNFDGEILVVLVESVVQLSAKAGSKEAREYLRNTWPELRSAHLRRLTKKQGE